MDLAAAFSGMQRAKILGQVQMAVARKVMDSQKMQGAAAVKLIEAASKGVSQAGDSLVAASIGLGGEIDTYA